MKGLVAVSVLAFAAAVNANATTGGETKKPRICWSLFWGGYTREGCPKHVKVDVLHEQTVTNKSNEEANQKEQKKLLELSDSSETKSILFGAVQWSSEKPPKIEEQDSAPGPR